MSRRGSEGRGRQCPRTFMLGMMRRNRNTMSMFTRRTMSHSDSRPRSSGFLERHTETGRERPRTPATGHSRLRTEKGRCGESEGEQRE